jgi:voltage-gated potassium channel Kch
MMSVVGVAVGGGGRLLRRHAVVWLNRTLHLPSDPAFLCVLFAGWCVVAGVSETLHLAEIVGVLLIGCVLATTEHRQQIARLIRPCRDFLGAFFCFYFGLTIEPFALQGAVGTALGAVGLTLAGTLLAGRLAGRAAGMRIPTPGVDMLLIAAAASVFLIASRFVTIFPMLYLLRLGHRTSLLPAINLTQMCDFTLVFASLGLAAGHIDRYIVAILILVYAITSTTSTYMITYNHELYQWFSRLLIALRLRDIAPKDARPAEDAATSSKRVVFLGFFREASSILHEFEIQRDAGDRHALLDEVLVIDFNPEVHAELQRRGIACVYGDVAHMDTLHHANIHGAALIVSTIPNAILKGTDNARLLRQARNLSPHAHVIVTAESLPAARYLYQQGADYVFLPRLHSAVQMAAVIEEGLQHGFEMLRAEQNAQLRQRNEVLA